MKWTQEYSLGIREIDEQHKRIVELFSKINTAIDGGAGWSAINYDILELLDFAQKHFVFEEALMRLYGYQEIIGHAESHLIFVAKIVEVQRQSLQKTTTDIALKELQQFSYDWLKKHILEEDKKYADYILSGVSIVRS